MESQVVALGDKKITVRELTVREIKKLADMPENVSVIDRLTKVLAMCAGGVKNEDLMDHAPSDLQPLVDAMIAVNESFFKQAEAIGMKAAGDALRQMLGSVSMIAFASVSEAAME